MSTQMAATPERIMQIGLGFWASKTLLSAIELGLFTVLADAPMDAEQLRARLGLHRTERARFLRRSRRAGNA